jgi:hypothetical protein
MTSSDGHAIVGSVENEALERARERLAEAVEGKAQPADVEAALDRARTQVEELAATAAELQTTLPDRIGEAVRDGLRLEARPVSRQLAEVRGLQNQTIRRLERLEAELLAERSSRVDDLGLLVDLIESSWRAVDDRLRRIEEAVQDRNSATVYRLGEAG